MLNVVLAWDVCGASKSGTIFVSNRFGRVSVQLSSRRAFCRCSGRFCVPLLNVERKIQQTPGTVAAFLSLCAFAGSVSAVGFYQPLYIAGVSEPYRFFGLIFRTLCGSIRSLVSTACDGFGGAPMNTNGRISLRSFIFVLFFAWSGWWIAV